MLRRQLSGDATVTVHLDSGTDVVIVEGRVVAADAGAAAVEAYDRKHDWRYDADGTGC